MIVAAAPWRHGHEPVRPRVLGARAARPGPGGSRPAARAPAPAPRAPRALAAGRARHGAGWPIVVACSGGDVVAFVALSPYRPAPAFARTAEDSVYVEPGRRGEGLGRLVLDELLPRGEAAGHHSVLARITARNTASLRLHERAGFRTVGVEREVAFKLGRWHDVTVMQLLLGGRSDG